VGLEEPLAASGPFSGVEDTVGIGLGFELRQERRPGGRGVLSRVSPAVASQGGDARGL